MLVLLPVLLPLLLPLLLRLVLRLLLLLLLRLRLLLLLSLLSRACRYFNFGMHNLNNETIPGQAGPIAEYAPHLDSISQKLRAWAGPAGEPNSTKLLFALTSPMLNSVDTDHIVLSNNAAAAAIMAKYSIPTIDLHQPIIDKCGPVPQASCFNSTGCWCVRALVRVRVALVA